jgi:hypothetical protein
MRSLISKGTLLTASIAVFAACGGGSDTTVVQPSATFTSTLNATNEVRTPPVASSATGTATYVLTGNGNVIVPFVTATVVSGTVTSGSIDLSQPISNGTTSITGDSLRTLLNNGGAYTNVHTALYGGGEIRGQIIKQ